MSVKIALLGFGTVASGVPFLLKENKEKIVQAAQSEIEVAKVLVKDDQEKARLLEAGNDFNFVTNIDEILSDKDITIVVELMGRIEPAKTFITRALEAGKHVVTANKDLLAVHGAELLRSSCCRRNPNPPYLGQLTSIRQNHTCSWCCQWNI